MNAVIAEPAGTRLSKILNMVNTNMHVFKHPKFYEEFRQRAKRCQKELRERNKSDQVISKSSHDGESERAPGPGHKHRASSSKQQASGAKLVKHQAASIKPQA
jgi:hypothetical protein